MPPQEYTDDTYDKPQLQPPIAMFPNRFITFLAIFASASVSAQAAVVWQADFSSYGNVGSGVNVTVDNTGNDDTLSGTSSTGTAGVVYTTQVVTTGSPLTGNALRLSLTNTNASAVGTNTFTRIFQGHQASLGGNGIYIMSADMIRTSSAASTTVRNYAATGDASIISSVSNTDTSTDVGTAVRRLTFVINQTGSALTLPGSLGSLADDAEAAYFYDGTNYTGLAITTGITNLGITGFATGSLRSSNFNAGQNVTVWYDNMGLWNSSSDTVGGVNVLQLAPGTVVPEPSTIALFLLAGVTMVVLRRRAVRAI